MDDPIAVKGKVTDRREIVEIGILFQCRLGIIPGLAELGVLHLQLDPLDLQFMKQPSRLRLCPGKVRIYGFREQKLFCAAAQLGCFSCVSFALFQDATSFPVKPVQPLLATGFPRGMRYIFDTFYQGLFNWQERPAGIKTSKP
jgi:hypothetical protein